MKKISIHIIALFVLASCSTQLVDPTNYIQFVENKENGLKVEKTIGDVHLQVQYKPIDYVICQEERSNEIAEETYQQKTKELEGLEYINLKLSNTSNSGEIIGTQETHQDTYFQKLQYFMTTAKANISWIAGKDTLKPTLYHFERTYGAIDGNTILLAFERKAIGDRTLIVDDQVLGIGRTKFKIEGNDINDLPKLKTTK